MSSLYLGKDPGVYVAHLPAQGSHGLGGALYAKSIVPGTPASGFASVPEAFAHAKRAGVGPVAIIGKNHLPYSDIHGSYAIGRHLKMPGTVQPAGYSAFFELGGKLDKNVAALGTAERHIVNPKFGGIPKSWIAIGAAVGIAAAVGGAALLHHRASRGAKPQGD